MKKLFDEVESRGGFVDKFDNKLNAVRIRLTAAQIKLLHTTPQTLIAAPGPNKFVQIDTVIGFLNYSTAVFTGANALEFRETNGAGTKVSEDISAAFLNSGVDIVVEHSGSVYWGQVTRLLNAPIVVSVPVADPGGATAASTLTIIVIYRIIKVYN